jgi:hypothetical protein
MSGGTLYETDAPPIEVRIYRNSQLRVRETCQNAEEAAAITALASDLDHVYLLVDDRGRDDGPGDVFLYEDPFAASEEDQPLADQQLPGYGAE